MITRLRAQNFKSWKDTGELRFAPLTGLFGTNSSGKTSILQILLMLKQTLESSDPNRVLNLGGDEKSAVDLGTFVDVIFGHRGDAPLQVSVSVSFPAPEDTQPLRFDVAIKERDQRMVVDEFAYSRPGFHRGMVWRPDGGYDFVTDLGRTETSSPPIGCYEFPPETGAAPGSSVYLFLAYHLKQAFGRVSYLGPLRENPRRLYLWGGTRPTNVGRDGEAAVQALLATRDERPPGSIRVAHWLKEMGLIHSFQLTPTAPNRRDFEVRVKVTDSSPEVLLPDVGFGVSQILPVLVLCHYAPSGSTLILEQPEIHLHPSVQAKLADVLIDVIKRRNVQIVVESHSEYLLRRLQRRIAEGVIPSNETALYFCEIDHGESKVRELEISEGGLIKNWPKDFFGDEMGEVAALTEAAMKHRLRKVK